MFTSKFSSKVIVEFREINSASKKILLNKKNLYYLSLRKENLSGKNLPHEIFRCTIMSLRLNIYEPHLTSSINVCKHVLAFKCYLIARGPAALSLNSSYHKFF